MLILKERKDTKFCICYSIYHIIILILKLKKKKVKKLKPKCTKDRDVVHSCFSYYPPHHWNTKWPYLSSNPPSTNCLLKRKEKKWNNPPIWYAPPPNQLQIKMKNYLTISFGINGGLIGLWRLGLR